ncbi:MAG: hypothetical protein ACI83P_001007 [Janthinobacterium sp.]|jgi:hypothetical protein
MTSSPPERGMAEPFEQRINEDQKSVVNGGISMQSRSSTVCAIEYLKSHNVGADVIERVLLHPQLRRSCRA